MDWVLTDPQPQQLAAGPSLRLILTDNHDLNRDGLNDSAIAGVVLDQNIGRDSCVLSASSRQPQSAIWGSELFTKETTTRTDF